MRMALIAAVLLASLPCVSLAGKRQDRQARWAELERPFRECQLNAIAKRDDGTTAVESVALVVLADCREEGIKWFERILPGEDPLDSLDRWISPMGVDLVSWRILDMRSAGRSKKEAN